MPLYHFDITEGSQVTVDEHGVELTDDEEARVEAISLCIYIARDWRCDGDHYKFVVAARNKAGRVVYEASLALNGRWQSGQR